MKCQAPPAVLHQVRGQPNDAEPVLKNQAPPAAVLDTFTAAAAPRHKISGDRSKPRFDMAALLAQPELSPAALVAALPQNILRNDVSMCELLRKRPAALAHVPANLLTLEMCMEAVRADFWTASDIPNHFLEDEHALAALTSTSAWIVMPLGLTAEREWMLQAVRRDGNVLYAASDALRADKEICLAAVSSHGLALEYVPPFLRNDPDVARAALAENIRAAKYLSPARRADPAFMEEAVQQHRLALAYAAPSLHADDAFLERCADLDPWSLHYVAPLFRQAVFDRRPDIEETFNWVERKLAEHGIEHHSRLPGWNTLQEALVQRTNQGTAGDTRPHALVIFPTSDHNRAYELNNLAELAVHYRLSYFEVSTEAEFVDAVNSSAERAGAAELLVIGGHGTKTHLAFGADDPAWEPMNTKTAHLGLSLESADVLEHAGLTTAVAPGGNVVLKSCSTGEGGRQANNLANLFARTIPHAHVWAPVVPTNNRMCFDDHGRFVDPGFKEGQRITLHLPPKAAANASLRGANVELWSRLQSAP